MSHEIRYHNPLENYTERKGLEGPFLYQNGTILYYDPKCGEYWDPKTDFYVPKDRLQDLIK